MHGQLTSKTYQPKLIKGVVVQKKSGGERPIKILSVRDRVVQKAIALKIEPLLSKKYALRNKASFAYHQRIGQYEALKAVDKYYKDGNVWVYKGDIKLFFDSVPREKLLSEMILPFLPDDNDFKSLLRSCLKIDIGNTSDLKRMGINIGNIFPDPAVGLPQGGMLSPLFSNIYLNSFDIKMLRAGFNLVRYADDFLVLCRSKKEAKKADQLSRTIIEKELKLKLHALSDTKTRDKSYFGRFENIDFLGIYFKDGYMYPSGRAWKKTITWIDKLPYKQKNLTWNLYYLGKVINSWGNTYFFTEIESHYYEVLNRKLRTALRRIFLYYKLRLITKEISRKTLKIFGLYEFDYSVRFQRDRHVKSKQIT